MMNLAVKESAMQIDAKRSRLIPLLIITASLFICQAGFAQEMTQTMPQPRLNQAKLYGLSLHVAPPLVDNPNSPKIDPPSKDPSISKPISPSEDLSVKGKLRYGF